MDEGGALPFLPTSILVLVTQPLEVYHTERYTRKKKDIDNNMLRKQVQKSYNNWRASHFYLVMIQHDPRTEIVGSCSKHSPTRLCVTRIRLSRQSYNIVKNSSLQ